MSRSVSVLAISVLFAFLILPISCKEQKSTDAQESTPSQFIVKAAPGEVGMDASILEYMEKAVELDSYPNIHSILISRKGKLVYEQYFEGTDELWGDSLGLVQNSRYRLHDVRSISKSIVSACVGLAIAQGKIKNVDQRVFDFFPEYAQYNTGLKSNLTIKHLLTMTSGLKWNEDVPYDNPENSEIRMTDSGDPVEFILSRLIETEPGKVWNYNGGTTQLLAVIIKKTTGMEIDVYADEYLFKPLGIKNYRWTYFPNLNLPAAASGLRLTSRDLLRFGLLYAQKGKWEGKQLLSSKWVNESLRSYVKLGRNNNVGYGYQFWIFKGSTIAEKHDHPVIAAVGNGDQRIYLDLEHELIVVTTAGNYNNWTIKKDSEALLTDFIYPALDGKGKAEYDPDSYRE